MKDWEQHSIHVLESLKRIEKKLDTYDSMLNEHIAEDAAKFEQIEGKINSVKQEVKFHSRIGSGLAVFVASVISWFIESRRHG